MDVFGALNSRGRDRVAGIWGMCGCAHTRCVFSVARVLRVIAQVPVLYMQLIKVRGACRRMMSELCLLKLVQS